MTNGKVASTDVLGQLIHEEAQLDQRLRVLPIGGRKSRELFAARAQVRIRILQTLRHEIAKLKGIA